MPFRFDEGAIGLQPGCGGSLADWHIARSIEDPRDGALRSVSRTSHSCLLIPDLELDNGAVAVSIASRSSAGVVLRYRDAEHYLSIELTPSAGFGLVGERIGEGFSPLALFSFEGRPRVDLVAVFDGTRLALFVDRVQVAAVTGITPQNGLAGPLAKGKTVAEYDDLIILQPEETRAGVISPTRLPIAQVGWPYETELSCLGPADDDPTACTYALRGGSLPEGLSLDPDGRIAGTPRAPFDRPLMIAATRADGRTTTQSIRLQVEAVSWPRFPFAAGSRIVPSLAVLYTPDDISQNVTLESLGAPDRLLFRLHADHPELKISMMSCPANRYISGPPLASQPKAAAIWRRLAMDPLFDWIELGGHGYTHSPDGDQNLHHHEFSVTQTGCNVDHSLMQDPEYCRLHMSAARESYRAAGIPDDRVMVMRFPGADYSPQAIRAAAEAGFIAILGSAHRDEPHREWWISHEGGEILEIQHTSVLALTVYEDLEKGLSSGTIAPSEMTRSIEFLEALEKAKQRLGTAASRGGILNLFNHWWETFVEVQGVMPRYHLFDALLDGINDDYAGRVWYSGAREMALWLDARRFAVVSWIARSRGLTLQIEPPTYWTTLGLDGLERASLRARLPVDCSDVAEVRAVAGASSSTLETSDYWVESGTLAVTFSMKGSMRLDIDCVGRS